MIGEISLRIGTAGDGPARRPSASGGAVEAAAAAANASRLAVAGSTLTSWFGVTSLEAWFSDPPEPRSARPRVGVPELLELSDHVLAFEDNRPPRLGLATADGSGGLVDFRSTYDLFRPDVSTLHSALAHGGALVLTGVERWHPALLELATAVTVTSLAPVSVDLLQLGPGAAAELMTTAEADWVLVAVDPVAADTGDGTVDLPAGSAIAAAWSGTDRPIAVHSSSPALVLRVQVARRTIDDVAAAVTSVRSRHHPLLRADLPFDTSDPVVSYGGSPFDRPDGFAGIAAGTAPAGSVSPAGAGDVSPDAGPLRLTDALAVLAGADRRVRIAAPTGWWIDADGDLVVGTSRLAGPPELLERVAELADGSWHSSAGWSGSCGQSGVAALASLLAAGLIEIAGGARD